MCHCTGYKLSALQIRIAKENIGLLNARGGFRERGALGHLSFGGPSICDLFGCLSEKREYITLLCVVFCSGDFGSTLDANRNYSLSYSSKGQMSCDLFLESIALSRSSEVLFVKFP